MSGNDLLAYLPDKPQVASQMPTPRVRVAHTDSRGYYTTQAVGGTFGDGNYDTFLRTSRSSGDQQQQPSSPTESSLSSAFGNGTHIPPTPLHPPPRVAIQPPSSEASYRQRDTIYTQASEASTAPRFRTVNSWVRQQTRKRADEVPEQGYGLMMPDGEVPRRVQHHFVRPEGVGFSR